MAAVDDFQSSIEDHAEETRQRGTALYLAVGEQLTRDDAVYQLAALINRANALAVTMADAYVVAQLEELLGSPVPAIGVLPTDDFERLTDSVRTVVDATANDQVVSRLERLSGNEPLQTAQKAASDALAAQQDRTKGCVGWVRQLNADACKLCQGWAKDGRIWPATYPMSRHTNCACVQRIVMTDTPPKPVRSNRSKR